LINPSKDLKEKKLIFGSDKYSFTKVLGYQTSQEEVMKAIGVPLIEGLLIQSKF